MCVSCGIYVYDVCMSMCLWDHMCTVCMQRSEDALGVRPHLSILFKISSCLLLHLPGQLEAHKLPYLPVSVSHLPEKAQALQMCAQVCLTF